MKWHTITARDATDGRLLNAWDTNSQQLADERVQRILKHHPDADIQRGEETTSEGGAR